MTRRNLILIHRGPEYEQDFQEIAAKAHAIDPSITIFYVGAGLRETLPDAEWQYPTLTVSLNQEFGFAIKRGPILRNVPIDKLEQQEIFRKNRIPTPPAMPFSFGMPLDPILFGEYVLLKPMDLRLTSQGAGIQVMRRQRAETVTPSEFPGNHPINWSVKGYAVQKFIYTGEYPTTYRVTTFLGEAIFGIRTRSDRPSPDLDAPDKVLEAGDFTQKFERTIIAHYEEDMLPMAKKVAAAFGDIPLLGIDFVRDINTSKVYALEVNAGGNTWHFSSEMWAERRRQEPDLVPQLKHQFSAFDVAAKALVERVHELAV